jgi:hypothetical protein
MNPLPEAADFDHTGFSPGEVAFLLSTTPGAASEAVRSELGVDAVPDSSTLTARGYLADGALSGDAAPIARILTSATRWSTADVSAGEVVERGVLVESANGKLVARQRPDLAWWFIVLDPDSVVSQVVAQGLRNAARRGDPLAATVRTASLATSRTFVVQRSGDAWRFCASVTGAREPEIHVAESTSDEAIEHLTAFVASWPAPLLA